MASALRLAGRVLLRSNPKPLAGLNHVNRFYNDDSDLRDHTWPAPINQVTIAGDVVSDYIVDEPFVMSVAPNKGRYLKFIITPENTRVNRSLEKIKKGMAVSLSGKLDLKKKVKELDGKFLYRKMEYMAVSKVEIIKQKEDADQKDTENENIEMSSGS